MLAAPTFSHPPPGPPWRRLRADEPHPMRAASGVPSCVAGHPHRGSSLGRHASNRLNLGFGGAAEFVGEGCNLLHVNPSADHQSARFGVSLEAILKASAREEVRDLSCDPFVLALHAAAPVPRSQQ